MSTSTVNSRNSFCFARAVCEDCFLLDCDVDIIQAQHCSSRKPVPAQQQSCVLPYSARINITDVQKGGYCLLLLLLLPVLCTVRIYNIPDGRVGR
jgi:hypothetical protein